MLESEIKNLTAAIERLIVALDKQPTAEQPVVAAPPVEEPVVVEQDTPSVDALQQRCLELTRIDRANGVKIKAIIAEYGAALLKDIPADKLGEFSIKLEQLA
jgi:hypothetical protein